ncbi:DUF4253 domain-containing protein [Hahella sp. HN01]|uniref:DUF4253 domain-containing protein n=1 Tax=Hahella sp. HN01 TaxID=2847262 RepID=UPI001C1EA5C6|nr:DUF4253 domain-containing protein [Hahella sp. HN01]MBU6953780.1 DUF4253 domain-containing protein [Hahella sp. HN01]
MLETEDQLCEILSGIGYDEHEVVMMDVPGVARKAFAVEITAGEAMDLWAEFRSISEQTGMWPVLHACWLNDAGSWREAVLNEDAFMRRPYGWEPSGADRDLSPQAICAGVEMADIQAVLVAHNRLYSEDLEENFEYSIGHTKERFGKVPSLDEINKLIAEKRITSYFEFERWMLEWEIQYSGASDVLEPEYCDHIDWYEPQGQAQALILLPTTKPWEALAYMHWYGAENVGSEASIAMLRHWHDKYGAELVAHYGTMLQFNAKSGPKDIFESFDLAFEQEALAPCTTALAGVLLRDHARSLMKTRRWFLHERP